MRKAGSVNLADTADQEPSLRGWPSLPTESKPESMGSGMFVRLMLDDG